MNDVGCIACGASNAGVKQRQSRSLPHGDLPRVWASVADRPSGRGGADGALLVGLLRARAGQGEQPRRARPRLQQRHPVARVAGLATSADSSISAAGGVGSWALPRRAGWDVVGIEFEPSLAEASSRRYGVPVVVGDAVSADVRGPFDVITMWHVLEHLPDPGSALARAAGLLRPGGTLIVSVPNNDSLQARLGGDDWLHLDIPRHIYHFTPGSLVAPRGAGRPARRAHRAFLSRDGGSWGSSRPF